MTNTTTQPQPFTGRAMSAFEVAQMQEDMAHLRVLWRALNSPACTWEQAQGYYQAAKEILEKQK